MYTELHCHSAFSFLDGASLPDDLVATALALGYESLALTDHNSVSGSMEFAVSAAALGLRAIHGAEIDLDDERHLTLLVEDSTGWSNLCRLLTRAHAHTREAPGPPSQAFVSLADVLEHAEGLVCLSGCALRGVHDERSLRLLLEAFGPDGLRIELQRPYLRDDRARNRRLASIASRLGIPCVATGNVHAHSRARAPLQDAFVAIRLHTTLDASEPQRRGNFSHVIASPEAMAARFPEHPDAVSETRRLADRLRFELCSDLGYRYPGADDELAHSKLASLCDARLHDRYQDAPRHMRDTAAGRLQEELRIIEKLRLAGFFLLHHDMLELAREVAVEVRGASEARALLPPGRGRGSSVSSIVCYLTGLSHVDPIANELMIGRFLNEELTSLPDIDLDFPRDIREVLIPRVHERYGHERSALVAAFPTYRARGAIRELGKALGLPAGEIERLARGSEGWDSRKVGEEIERTFGSAHRSGRWEWLAELAAQAYGLPRHLSQHSGGMIVATRPLIDCCPIVPAAMEGRQIVQWDKDSCSDAGFLKIDVLGLGMLSAVERCVEMIARTRGERIDLSRIPYDDRATYDCIQSADTTGVFQIESRAQMQSLRRTRPANLKDLTIQVAIVRPGPIQGGAVNPYIERRQRLRMDPGYQVPYEHPSLEEPLRETLGTIIFQDQVLEVAIAFAGFSPGEAEGLRRAMSRKRSEAAIEAHHRRFVAGAQRLHGVDEETAERVFSMVQGFSGFGFPKAHGAAFGLLAYQSTWLRVHYGPEFLCALMNEQPMGFYPPDALVHEAQRRGITVLPPDVNESEAECSVPGAAWKAGGRRGVEDLRELPHGAESTTSSGPNELWRAGDEWGGAGGRRGVVDLRELPDGAESTTSSRTSTASTVRIGLGYVRGVRGDEVRALVQARERGGRFRSLSDLASRAGAGAPSLELLAWSGACDSLAAGGGRDRRLARDAREGSDPGFAQPVSVPAATVPAARAASQPGHAGSLRGRGALSLVAGSRADGAVAGSRAAAPPAVSGAAGSPTGADRADGAFGRSRSSRREALWQLGVCTPGRSVPGGVQLALPLDLPAPPKLRELSRWDSMLADYRTIGLTVDAHPISLLRDRLPAGTITSRELEQHGHGSRVRVGGMVVARQRPGTAGGVVFVLLEDEHGTINLIVPPPVYERHRLLVRTEPLLLVEGKLERFAAAGGAINVLVDKLASIPAPDRIVAQITDFSLLDEQVRIGLEEQRAEVEDFNAVAPPVMSFASGRRR